jgi:methionyl-tRNA formyltransferase
MAIVRRVRAFTPRPGAFTFAGGRRLLVRAVCQAGADAPVPTGVAGTVGEPRGEAMPVRCGDGQAVLLLRVQPQGSVEMDAAAAARGRRLAAGMILTSR